MRTTTIVLLAAVALTLTGCSSQDDKPTPAATAPTITPADRFITSIADAQLASYTGGIPAAAELTVFPPKWCDALEAGHSVEWMLDGTELYPVGETWGTEKTDAYQLVLLGVRAYCPKWEKTVRQELRESGEY
jgi:hypothetical protein